MIGIIGGTGLLEDESRPCRHTLRGPLLTPLEGLSAEQRALVDFLLV